VIAKKRRRFIALKQMKEAFHVFFDVSPSSNYVLITGTQQ